MGRALKLATPNRRPIPEADSTEPMVDDPRPRRPGARRAKARRSIALMLALPALVPLAVAGCRSSRSRGGDVAVLEPSAIPTPRPAPIATPAATPTPPAVESTLERADRAFEAGDYESARSGYETHLGGLDAATDADRVLYRLAVLNLAKNGGGRDTATGFTLLRRLVREHPESPYRMEAELILGLNAKVDGLETEVEKLEGQLEALKRIDLDRSQERRSP